MLPLPSRRSCLGLPQVRHKTATSRANKTVFGEWDCEASEVLLCLQWDYEAAMSWYHFLEGSGSSRSGFQSILPCAPCLIAGMYGSQITISWVNGGGTLSSSIIWQKISVVALLQSRRRYNILWIRTQSLLIGSETRVISGKTYILFLSLVFWTNVEI